MGNLTTYCPLKKADCKDRRNKFLTVFPNHTIDVAITNHKHPNHGFAANKIKTTKYTPLTFLPKNLLEQFHRIANLYFIFLIALNWVPAVNAFGKELSMLPVLFVLAVTAVKDAVEDWRRFRSDRLINLRSCRVYNREKHQYEPRQWQHVRVGDFIHLSCNEVIPADLLLLKSSDPQGICHIETANLDGETNLKIRRVVDRWQRKDGGDSVENFRYQVCCEEANNSLHVFHGFLSASESERVPLDHNNLILRGCVVRNTDFVEGLVIYAGADTKALQNTRGARYKRSHLERRMNRDVIFCVLILLILCVICAIGSYVWLQAYDQFPPFLILDDDENPHSRPHYHAFITFLRSIIIFQVMIPLSLYVTVELIKLGQVYFIAQDLELYDAKSDRPIECRALNITEELGQVQFVFSDKTGTLTENRMIFRACSVYGQHYLHYPNGGALVESEFGETSYTKLSHANESRQKTRRRSAVAQHVKVDHNYSIPMNLQLERTLDESCRDIVSLHRSEPALHSVNDFLVMMALCNTVVVSTRHVDLLTLSEAERSVSQSSTKMSASSFFSLLAQEPAIHPSNAAAFLVQHLMSSGTDDLLLFSHRGLKRSTSLLLSNLLDTHYEAESPDELALCNAAACYDYKLIYRTQRDVMVGLPNNVFLEFKLLHTLPFDAERKCMSVVVRHPMTQQVIVYCKGADSTIMECLEQNDDGNKVLAETQRAVECFSRHGLRILCFAKRVLADEEYLAWLQAHQRAECALENRPQLLMDSARKLERNLTLLGATGVEDQLQQNVPETISLLRQASVNVWVLTGDKEETAVNIAFSCQLMTDEQEIIALRDNVKENLEAALDFHLDQAGRDVLINTASDRPPLWKKIWRRLGLGSTPPYYPRRPLALVIDGKTLALALQMGDRFLQLAAQCQSVLCCRATPMQKAQVVHLVKEKLKVVTLAIGDGANDVSMIQTADVGVGIAGSEGMQAVMASDFAIARFCFLSRLLLVHGRWCYTRLARLARYFFFKSSAYILVLFWYQLLNGFSGSVMIDQVYLMLFNVTFTSVPPLVNGILDRDVTSEQALAQPQLYLDGQRNRLYRPHSFWTSFANAMWHSLCALWIPYFFYAHSAVGMWEFGTAVNTICVITMLLELAVLTRTWTWIHVLSNAVSMLVLYLGFAFVFSAACVTCNPPSNPYSVLFHLFAQPSFWFTLILSCTAAVLPGLSVAALYNTVTGNAAAPASGKQRPPSRCYESDFVHYSASDSEVRILPTNSASESSDVVGNYLSA